MLGIYCIETEIQNLSSKKIYDKWALRNWKEKKENKPNKPTDSDGYISFIVIIQ